MFLNPWYGSAAPAAPAAVESGGEDINQLDQPVSGSSTSSSAESTTSTASTASVTSHVIPPLDAIQKRLKKGWTVHVNREGRLFYCNVGLSGTGQSERRGVMLIFRHSNQTSSWLPPLDNWDGHGGGSVAETPPLPYGWEAALDREGKPYFINHLNKTTTYEDPRKDWTEDPPQPRHVELARHPELGFGFVAGSERPVIVRFVTEGGPSVEKLLPGDQILEINGEDVRNAPRDHVIQLVRSCKDSVQLTVCQPPLDNSARKSAILSAAKKAKLKSNPSRVRFAEGVVINGTPLSMMRRDQGDQALPFLPNVMKVYLENGQTKSFKYDSATTVADVLVSLQQKLSFKSMDHFSLCVEHVKSLRRNKLTLLDSTESLARIAARPGAHNLRCLLRVAFVPKDAYELLRKDTGAFEYLFMQCCNDVVQERFAPELKYDIALRLAALHIQQHAVSNKMQGKVTVKNVEREFGLERFVPASLVEAMKRKELRKLLSHFLKANQNLVASGQKHLTALQAKLHYLKIIADLPSYGAKCFSTSFSDSNIESVILISPKYAISRITGLRNSTPLALCDIEDVTSVALRREDELTQHLEIRLKDPDKETIVLSLEERDADELVLVLRGYYKLLTDRALLIHRERNRWTDDAAPPYPTRHCVESAQWSFLDHTGDHAVTDTEASKILKFVDLSTPPPYHPPPEGFQIHQNFGVTQDFEDDQASDMDSCKGVQLDLSPQVNRARLDRNMNKPLPNNNIESNTSSRQCNVTNSAVNIGQELGFDVPSILSMEILESERGCPEARNDAILRRVSDMRRLVEESEQYLISDSDDPKPILKDVDSASLLSDLSRTESDVSSGPPYGQLRHSDSLLLLTQGQKQLLDIPTDGFPEAVPVEAPDSEGHDPSGSDTDSLNTPNATPTHSPSQRPKAVDRNARPVSMLKPSDSSFGLHSPDVIPALKGDDSEMQDLLKRLQEDHALPYPFAEGTLYLDPDIIDLTMIPPPITPEEEGLKMMPTTLSAPPTPFADRLSLEVELQGSGMIARLPALPEMGDLGDLRDLNDLSQWSEIHSDTSSVSRGMGSSSAFNTSSEVDDTLSMSSFSNSVTSRDSFTSPSPSPSNTDSTASSRKTLSSQWSVDNSADNDLDSFLAAVAFPPPPQSSNKPTTSKTTATESAFKLDSMNSEDLSAFIIPPPPSNLQEEGGKGLEALQKLYQAREGIDQVMSQDSDGSCSDIDFGEKDRTVYELKLGSEMRTGPNKEKIGPKIAKLQKQFAMSARKESSDGSSSGYGSVKSDAESSSDTPDIPARMPASPKKSFLMNALKPPTTIIKVPNKSNLGTVTVTNKLTPAPSPKPSLLSTLQKQHSLPSHPVFDHFHYHVCEDDDIPPPPPPPRNPIPRHAYTLQKPSASSTKTPSLARSSSQTELCLSLPEAPPALAPKQILKPGPVLPVHGKRSASSDSILSPRVSPSPSKWSMTSSSDSLASSASVATVKAAPGVGANEDTPPLPPRSTLPRDKPPLPNDSGKFASKSARSPSPQEKPDGSRPPVLPSRLKKPSTTTPAPPVAHKVTITKLVPKLSPNGYGKPAAPSPTSKTSSIPVYASPPNNSAIPRPGSASSSPSKRAVTTVNNKTVHSGTQSGLRPQTHQSPIRKPIAWAESDTESPIASITKKPPLVEPEDMQITLESPSSPQSSPLTNGAFYSVGQSRLPRAASTSSPLHTRSPKLSPKPVLNGTVHTYKAEDPKMWYVNNASESQHSPNSRDDSNSVDSGSFENDSLDSSTELDIKLQCLQAEGIITRILSRLSMPGATLSDDEVLKTDVILAAKDRLAQESRQFVTASKLFVKSTTESPQTMATCLIQCVALVERMAEASSQMPVTIQGQDLNAKVKDVARAFHHTIKAASEAAGHGVNEPAMGRLMGKATALASVLTVLMRSLRPGA